MLGVAVRIPPVLLLMVISTSLGFSDPAHGWTVEIRDIHDGLNTSFTDLSGINNPVSRYPLRAR
jgi:hypothetical protein